MVMKRSKKAARIVAVALSAALGCGTLAAFAGCGKKGNSLVIMTQELNGLFNPFFSTAGTDMDVVGQTQIGMLSTDNSGNPAYGDNEPVVVKDYKVYTENGVTKYDFVLKNGIVFSDGTPLTMNDVLFNMYVYLDPAYTGSTTMYSTDIVGLKEYRTQQTLSGDATAEETALNTQASGRARNRRDTLVNLYHTVGKTASEGSYEADEAKMKDAIATANIPQGYYAAIFKNGNIDGVATNPFTPSAESTEEARKQLLSDYETTLTKFHEELENDFNTAKDAYQSAPYTNEEGKPQTNFSGVEFDEILSFMYMEGYVTIEYNRDSSGVEDKNSIKTITPNYANVSTRDEAIEYVYRDNVENKFDYILTSWATASNMLSEFTAKAKDVILHERLKGDELAVKNISGIVSLGHVAGQTATSVTIGDTTYPIAREHNEDGTPKNADEYDVLEISVNGTDPKAIWNFGFTVAPYHYYSDPSQYPVNIANNQFGVKWSDFDFMTKVIQGRNSYGASKNKVPLGAGPYIATDKDNSDNPQDNDFLDDNVVYYKANDRFLLGAPKIKQMRYQVVSSTNALMQLEQGGVHFVEPQFTQANAQKIDSLKKKGFESVSTWQLGYGYIGINAGKVSNIYLRRAIMAAMNTSLSLEYYTSGTADTINWPMSMVSWAYPREGSATMDPNDPLKYKLKENGHAYTMFTTDEAAKEMIRQYMGQANATTGDSRLTLRFTIAGSNLTDHPCYSVFKHAQDLLNECGWKVEVLPDTNALTKLATGSLTVWAAAWGSTIDPDMYQVYHKNSTATSTLAWGYREILANTTLYREENSILNDLSDLIDRARETNVQTERASLYRDAMSKVLDLAVELPVYQRQTLYAYNAKVIDEKTLPHDADGKVTINAYTSPLSRIWEVDFVK